MNIKVISGKRQTGKTTSLVNDAKSFLEAESNNKAIFLGPNEYMLKSLKDKFSKEFLDRCFYYSWQTFKKGHLRGIFPVSFFIDEPDLWGSSYKEIIDLLDLYKPVFVCFAGTIRPTVLQEALMATQKE